MPRRTSSLTSSPSASVSFSSTLERSENKIWGMHLVVPLSIVQTLEEGNRKSSIRLICTLNGSVEFQCGLQRYGAGRRVIVVSKERQRQANIVYGDAVEVEARIDQSKYGLPMPEELEELLRQDAIGRKKFHTLPAGIQRTLIYIVGNVKNPEQRMRRSLVIVRHLKASRGQVDYKALHTELMAKPGRETAGRRPATP